MRREGEGKGYKGRDWTALGDLASPAPALEPAGSQAVSLVGRGTPEARRPGSQPAGVLATRRPALLYAHKLGLELT